MNIIKTTHGRLIRMSLAIVLCFGSVHSIQSQIKPKLKIEDIPKSSLDNGVGSNIRFFPDGKKILTTGNVAKIWNLETGENDFVFRGHDKYNHGIEYCDISPDGKLVATGGSSRRVIVWNVATGEEILTFQTFPEQAPFYANVAFFPDGKKIIAYDSRRIQVWDIESNTMLKEFENSATESSPVEFFNDGKRFLFSYYPAMILSLEDGSIVQSYEGRGYLNQQNQRIYVVNGIAGTDTNEYQVSILDERMVEREYTFPVFSLKAKGLEFTPDFKYLFALLTNESEIHVMKVDGIVDAKNSARLVNYNDDHIDTGFHKMSISPDGKKVAALTQKEAFVYIWDVTELTSGVKTFDSLDQ
jgi:WD40 repeat protein